MIIAQLIEELKKWPQNMPVAVEHDIYRSSINDPHWIKIEQCTHVDSNYPHGALDFEYLNLG